MHLNEELKQIGLEMTEIEIKPGSPLLGQTVGDVEVSGSGGLVIVALKKADGTLVRDPRPDVQLAGGDVFVILGHSNALPQVTRRVNARVATAYRGRVYRAEADQSEQNGRSAWRIAAAVG